jgi:hypothetical protein
MDRQAYIDKWPELPEMNLDFLKSYPKRKKEAGDLSQMEVLSELRDIEHLHMEIDMVHGLDATDYFAIGHSGCGDYYLMELGIENPNIILWNHETGEFEEDEEYSSLEEFAGEMLSARDYVESKPIKKTWWKIF